MRFIETKALTIATDSNKIISAFQKLEALRFFINSNLADVKTEWFYHKF